MANQPEETRFPTLPDGWAEGTARRAEAPSGDAPLARAEKERRTLIMALPVFLLAAVVLFVLGSPSLALPAVGVSAGYSIRLFLVQRKVDRLRAR